MTRKPLDYVSNDPKVAPLAYRPRMVAVGGGYRKETLIESADALGLAAKRNGFNGNPGALIYINSPAIKGDLEKIIKEESEAAKQAVTLGILEAATGLREELRQQVIAAGLGAKMARTWRQKRYPSSGFSIGAAGLVYSKAPLIIRAFSEGAVIKSDKGMFLAIPTAAAPKRGVGGKRINPDNFPEHSLGRLRFVYRKGAPSLLVVDNLRAGTGKRGGYRKASESALKTGRGLATVVMFILLPQVMLKKRLDVDGAMQRWRDKLPQLILQNFTETNDAER